MKIILLLAAALCACAGPRLTPDESRFWACVRSGILENRYRGPGRLVGHFCQAVAEYEGGQQVVLYSHEVVP